jgi:predicted amidophosphoribosyltransferase
VCGAVGAAPCPLCSADLRPPPSLPPPPNVDSCRALFAYEGAGRELVARLKYRNARSSLPFLAEGLADLVTRSEWTVDVVTWAPTTAARRRQRGFDQAELLARALARRLRVPCRRLLRRPPGGPQTGQPLGVRRTGPVFHAARPSPPRVLLVDDVVTSGATVAAAARSLRAAGAGQIHVVAAARTAPDRHLPWPGLHSQRVAVCGSVVESRGQSQAKRPT